jgi:hypothetical protein
MTKLIPIQFDENTVIYIEATEEVDVPSVPTETGGPRQGSKGAVSDSVKKQAIGELCGDSKHHLHLHRLNSECI